MSRVGKNTTLKSFDKLLKSTFDEVLWEMIKFKHHDFLNFTCLLKSGFWKKSLKRPWIQKCTIRDAALAVFFFWEKNISNRENLISNPQLFLLNVRSLNQNKMDIICAYICDLDVSVLCLTKIYKSTIEAFHLNNYLLQVGYCREERIGGGVAILTKPHLHVKPIELSNFSCEKDFVI